MWKTTQALSYFLKLMGPSDFNHTVLMLNKIYRGASQNSFQPHRCFTPYGLTEVTVRISSAHMKITKTGTED